MSKSLNNLLDIIDGLQSSEIEPQEYEDLLFEIFYQWAKTSPYIVSLRSINKSSVFENFSAFEQIYARISKLLRLESHFIGASLYNCVALGALLKKFTMKLATAQTEEETLKEVGDLITAMNECFVKKEVL